MEDVIFDSGVNIWGPAPRNFFFPIDSIYGEFFERDANIDDGDPNNPELLYYKEQWYLRNENNQIVNLAIGLGNNIERVAFSIFRDAMLRRYHLNVQYFDTTDEGTIRNAIVATHGAVQVLVVDADTIRQNLNFQQGQGELFLRIGRFSEDRYVIFFHGRTESNNPGRIPSS